MTPDLWLNEGGQSATGALLDHILAWHAQGKSLGDGVHQTVLARITELRAEEGDGFADRLHVLPDFHGNRSPLADPHAVGVISGLTLDSSFDSLARLYYRTAVGIALGTRHILDALNDQGYAIDYLHVAGGHTKNPLLMELYADTTGCKVIAPAEDDVVLLGTAIAAAPCRRALPEPQCRGGSDVEDGRHDPTEHRTAERPSIGTIASSSPCIANAGALDRLT